MGAFAGATPSASRRDEAEGLRTASKPWLWRLGDEDNGGGNGCSRVAAVGCFVGGGGEEIMGGSAIDMLSLRDASRPTHPDIKVRSNDSPLIPYQFSVSFTFGIVPSKQEVSI